MTLWEKPTPSASISASASLLHRALRALTPLRLEGTLPLMVLPGCLCRADGLVSFFFHSPNGTFTVLQEGPPLVSERKEARRARTCALFVSDPTRNS